VVALAVEHWWLSGVVAVVAALALWRRHPRARFTTYVLLSAVALRGVFGRVWGALALALAVIALMQLPAARPGRPRPHPRAPARRGPDARRPGRGPSQGDDRMSAP
jgi:hypothetical protein